LLISAPRTTRDGFYEAFSTDQMGLIFDRVRVAQPLRETSATGCMLTSSIEQKGAAGERPTIGAAMLPATPNSRVWVLCQAPAWGV